MNILPYGRHQLDDEDIEAVVDVLKNGALTCGPKVDAFEAAFAQKIGAEEAVVCSNGTTALHLAMLGLGLGPGDAAIVPAVTFLSTANVVRMVGADVVFADVDPTTGLMTADTLSQAFSETNRPVKAVMPVHLNGQCVEMDSVLDLAKAYGSQVVTDCCHALGAEYAGQAAGRPGDGRFETLGCFSLHPVKSIAMGEGGMVTTNDPAMAERLRRLRGHDMRRDPEEWLHPDMAFDPSGEPNPWYYEMHELGYNYRATDIQCALGLSQLAKLDGFIARRRALADRYAQLLSRLSSVVRPVPRTAQAQSAWHLYPVLIDFDAVGKSRAKVMEELRGLGVGTQVHYVPLPDQPYYRGLYGAQVFEGARAYYQRVLSLPIFPAMSDDDVGTVCDALAKTLEA